MSLLQMCKYVMRMSENARLRSVHTLNLNLSNSYFTAILKTNSPIIIEIGHIICTHLTFIFLMAGNMTKTAARGSHKMN